jgi:hypothetical protein
MGMHGGMLMLMTCVVCNVRNYSNEELVIIIYDDNKEQIIKLIIIRLHSIRKTIIGKKKNARPTTK